MFSLPQEEHHPGMPAPQSMQNRMAAGCRAPHAGQAAGNRVPQSPQKR
jgi:hypothetical protein